MGLENEDSLFAIAFASTLGVGVANLQVDGNLEPLDDWVWSAVGEINAMAKLQITSENTHLIALGNFGEAVIEVDLTGSIEATNQLSDGIRMALEDVEANVTSVAHGAGPTSPLTLLVGTDRGSYHLKPLQQEIILKPTGISSLHYKITILLGTWIQ